MIDELERLVRQKYEAQNPQRADWCDWLYGNHVFIVTEMAEDLAGRKSIDVELSKAAAMLHDIADTEMDRFDPEHEERSLQIGRELMHQAGFSEDDIAIVIDDAGKFHGCHDGITPKSDVGKVLATADALAHLDSDFYDHFQKERLKELGLDGYKKKVLSKLERDFNQKIMFDDVRERVRPNYERLKTHIESLV